VSRIKIERALISVYDKSGLDELARGLHDAGVEIVSTGTTAAHIRDLGVPVTPVEDVTGFPEILGGRVKTLHPHIHAGLLADQTNPEHLSTVDSLGIQTFQLVVSNLYPFADAVRGGARPPEAIEQIDIGGPAMVRASAKNHGSVAVVTDPAMYTAVLDAVGRGGFELAERERLAAAAFRHTATYDIAVASYLGNVVAPEAEGFPGWVGASWERAAVLRYGENPHQQAALYVSPDGAGIAQADQLGGKEMSYNNYVDADAARRAAYDFTEPCVAIIKHANPCGIAIGTDVAEAHRKAHACDPVSAYGGVIATNAPVSLEMATQVAEIFTEVIVAPAYDDDPESWTLATGAPADDATLADLAFAWRAVRAAKSNAILLAHDRATVGIGMGQVNRVDSCRLAVARAGDRATGSVAASDAYFPFPDGLQVLLDAGVRAVVQPGGSIRDDQAIAAAAAAGVPMYFTGTRHFAH